MRKIIIALFVCMVLVLVGSILVALEYTRTLKADRNWVEHTNQVIDQSRVIEQALLDAESGQRGFLLTGDPHYLDIFQEAADGLPVKMDVLQKTVSDNPMQVEHLDSLRRGVATRLKELEHVVALYKAGDLTSALGAVSLNNTHAIRNLNETIVRDEQELLAGRSRKLIETQHILSIVAVSGVVISLAILIGAFFWLFRNYRVLDRLSTELTHKTTALRNTIENIRDGLAIIEPDGRLGIFNDRLSDVLGLKRGVLKTAMTLQELEAVGREHGIPLLESIVKWVPDVELNEASYTGKIGDLDYECFVYRQDDGGIILSCADISDRVRTEAIIRQTQKMEAIGRLTGGIAHDFNNLMQVVQSNIELILMTSTVEGNPRKWLENAMSGAQRGASLTRQLLAFARQQPLEPSATDFKETFESLLSLLQQAVGGAVEIELVIAQNLWRSMIDRDQFENAMLNLAINAHNAMPSGGKISIEVENTVIDKYYADRHSEVSPGEYVMVAFSDTGEGMPPEVVAHAFDPFFTTKKDGRGTGLGLSMVYGFVKQSEGHVKIYSEVGHGTTIKIYLPRTDAQPKRYVSPAPHEIRGNNELILVVEDDEAVQASAIAVLQALGYRPVRASNGDQALAMLRGGLKPEILFTDIIMPGNVKARELATEAKKLLPGIAILFTSGFTENAVIHHGRVDEDVHLLTKPYSPASLSEKLAMVLREARHLSPAVDYPANRQVALIEDDALIRMSTKMMLEDAGLRVDDFEAAEGVLEALSQGKRYSVIVTDVKLPGLSGTELARKVRALDEDIKIVIASGIESDEINTLADAFLRKPYGTESITEMMRQIGL